MAEQVYRVSEVAREVGRVPHTIRMWDKVLPRHLKPTRDARGWRVWTGPQIEGIKQWLIDEDRRPGKGLESVRRKRP